VKLSVKSEALAFLIWQYATPREWNVTLAEIADHLGESAYRVSTTMRWRGWISRVRVTSVDADNTRLLSHHGGMRAAARHVSADLAAGRIGNGESI
jgi:hypothetical protein